jgi:SAM-dependent methyltransferase
LNASHLEPSPLAAPAAIEWHPSFGPALPGMNWVPAPRYLMRRDILLRLLADRTPGRIIEFGCGAGSLLAELARKGFVGIGIEQSDSALRLSGAMTQDTPAARVIHDVTGIPAESQDYLAAFEVLEHIEDDRAALSDWTRFLRRGGEVIVSVPAHPERWNAADIWAGHYRRYTRHDLSDLAAGIGLQVESILCYGFPVANLMERVVAPIYARQLSVSTRATIDKAEQTGASGSDRRLLTRLWPFYRTFPIRHILTAVLALQRRFLASDRGIGYIMIARKL